MKAIIIKPETQSIEQIDISGLDDVVSLIGFDSVISDAIDNDGNFLYFDEDCFIRGTKDRFQVDSMIPVSGIGVVVGADEKAGALKDVTLSVDDIVGRLKYL